MRKGLYLIAFLVFIVMLAGCSGEEQAKNSDEKTSRLILIAMDFSESTANTDLRDKEINIVGNISQCFEIGDSVHLYQITNESFSNPKKILTVNVRQPGRLETPKAVIRESSVHFRNFLKSKYNEIKNYKYPGTDITGFLHFAYRSFSHAVDSDKYMIIISDGIESSDAINPLKLMSSPVSDIINSMEQKNQIADLKGWTVIRTGEWIDKNVQEIKAYDNFWKAYFTKSQSEYKLLGLPAFDPIDCKGILK